MEQQKLREVFVPGIIDYVPELSQGRVIMANRRGDRPEYPYMSFSFDYNGLAPWETLQRTVFNNYTVDSEEVEWDKDYVVDWTADVMLTVSCDIVDKTSGNASMIAMKVESYWRYLFNKQILEKYHGGDEGYDRIWFRQVQTNAVGFDIPNGQATREARYTVDAQVVVPLEYEEQIETIERVRFNGKFGGSFVDPEYDVEEQEIET